MFYSMTQASLFTEAQIYYHQNHQGFDNDGHKPRRPQTTTTTATNLFSEDGMTVNSP